jgi:hypothetical protein
MSFDFTPRVTFGKDDGATFVRVCEKCCRFVRPFKRVKFDYNGQPVGFNAWCKVHGKTKMFFQGYVV